MTIEEKIRMTARCLKALAHPTRLQIVAVLADKEMSVQQMTQSLNLSQSSMSQHLNLLKDRNALHSRREGSQVFYRVRDKKILKLIDLMHEIFGSPKR
ncbi:MAG: ArsR family transcriptional regulator [Candidatus Manganitrophaceae bacterium]|nr:MAG: ArsR family transcriptional regulator [Candidatus Manganitrophaceae bacterium]